MDAGDEQLAAAECIDVIEGAVALLDRIREDTMGSGDAMSKEIAAVQEALKSVLARLEAAFDTV